MNHTYLRTTLLIVLVLVISGTHIHAMDANNNIIPIASLSKTASTEQIVDHFKTLNIAKGKEADNDKERLENAQWNMRSVANELSDYCKTYDHERHHSHKYLAIAEKAADNLINELKTHNVINPLKKVSDCRATELRECGNLVSAYTNNNGAYILEEVYDKISDYEFMLSCTNYLLKLEHAIEKEERCASNAKAIHDSRKKHGSTFSPDLSDEFRRLWTLYYTKIKLEGFVKKGGGDLPENTKTYNTKLFELIEFCKQNSHLYHDRDYENLKRYTDDPKYYLLAD